MKKTLTYFLPSSSETIAPLFPANCSQQSLSTSNNNDNSTTTTTTTTSREIIESASDLSTSTKSNVTKTICDEERRNHITETNDNVSSSGTNVTSSIPIENQLLINNKEMSISELLIRDQHKSLLGAANLRREHFDSLPENLLSSYRPPFLYNHHQHSKSLFNIAVDSSSFKMLSFDFSATPGSLIDNQKLKMDVLQNIYQPKKHIKYESTNSSIILNNIIQSEYEGRQQNKLEMVSMKITHNSAADNVNKIVANESKCNFSNDFDGSEQIQQHNLQHHQRHKNYDFSSNLSLTNANLEKNENTLNYDFDAKNNKRDFTECPICGISLIKNAADEHFQIELDNLYKLNRTSNCCLTNHKFSPSIKTIDIDISAKERHEAFQRIKENRQNRLRNKTRKRKLVDYSLCFQKNHKNDLLESKNQESDEAVVDVENDDESDNLFQMFYHQARKQPID